MMDGFQSINDLLEEQRIKETKNVEVTEDSQDAVRAPVISSADSPSLRVERAPGEENLASKVEEKFEATMGEIQLDSKETATQQRALELGLPYINLVGFPIGPEIISMIPESVAIEQQVVTFFRHENQIRIAVVDPDAKGIHDIVARLQSLHSNANVQMYITSAHSLTQALKLYRSVATVKEVEYGVRITAEQIERYTAEITSYEELEDHLKDVDMSDAFAILISTAMNTGSSDVHIEAMENGGIVRFRVDGVLLDVAELPKHMVPQLVNRIKAISGMKINIRSKPQDGRITIKLGSDDELDIRASALPSAYGESVVFRLLRSSSIGLSFTDLGFRPATFKRLEVEINKPNGMIITTGPTGSGKTTTLYAILNTLNSPETKIITLENPIEYKLKGIVQSQIDHAKGYDFESGLRSILRQDPDIVMVGEIRDHETAKTAIDASLTGHLMLSTIHTNDASGVIPRLMGMGIDGVFLAPSLNAVIGQRLVRRVCSECKKEYTPEADQLQKMKEWIAAIPESSEEERPDVDTLTFYKGEGCDACNGTGYKGRIGVYEVFTMVPEIEKQILSGQASEFEMKRILKEAGMVSMGQDGMLKVSEGITTLDEVFRVTKS